MFAVWLHAVQGIYCLASLNCVISLCLFYLFYLTAAPWSAAYRMLGVIALLVIASCESHTIVVTLGGIRVDFRLRQANERRRYFVTTSLIGWAQA